MFIIAQKISRIKKQATDERSLYGQKVFE